MSVLAKILARLVKIDASGFDGNLDSSIDDVQKLAQEVDDLSTGGGGSGTVTSVAISGSDGIEVDSGSPVTTSGTIALGVNAISLRTHINVEDGADVTDAVNIASSINGATGKTTPVDGDSVGLIDSEASNVLKNLTWANIKATLKTYFDTLYSSYPQGTGTLTDGASIAWNLNSKLDNRQRLVTSQSTITLTISNVVADSVNDLRIKKSIAGNCTITLAGSGITFNGFGNGDFNTTPQIVLSGAADDWFEISILADTATEVLVDYKSNGN